MPTTPPPEESTQAAVEIIKQLQLLVNSSAFTSFHAIVAENEKLKDDNKRLRTAQEENCVLLTRKQNDLNASMEDDLRHRAERDTAWEETKLLREELKASKELLRQALSASEESMAEAEKKRNDFRSEVTILMTRIKELQTATEEWKERATEHENLRAQANTAAMEASQELKATKKELSSVNSRLEGLGKYSYTFREPEWAEVSRSLQSLFGEAHEFINSYFNIDLDQQILANPEAWSPLANHESILRVLPLRRSNSAPAKLMRVAAVLCVLATSLTENLFQPTYLLGLSNELAYLLDDILQTDAEQERHLRAQLLRFEPKQQEINGRRRVEGVVVDVFGIVSQLLPPAQQHAFRDGLEKVCKSALGTWTRIQRLGARVEPMMDGDLWRLLPAAPSTATPRAAGADFKLVVWPGFLVAEPAGVTVLSDGFAVTEGQAQAAAREEVAKAVPERHRSARRRSRANTNRASAASKPFLSSDSGKQSSGG